MKSTNPKEVENESPLSAVSINVTSTKTAKVSIDACGPLIEDDEDELEEMFIQGPAGMEWNGPTRGGARPEPTRFGDWEKKGRCSDF
jgi:hypothetical protein